VEEGCDGDEQAVFALPLALKLPAALASGVRCTCCPTTLKQVKVVEDKCCVHAAYMNRTVEYSYCWIYCCPDICFYYTDVYK
jgi:hypothetical protein